MSAKKRVVIGMSGGVDSSVAAWLLKEQGYEVIGLFMKNWEDDDNDEYCSTRQDLIDAASAADVVGVELQAVNFAAEYKDRVFSEFLREYSAGRTPNPDVLCNAEIKFKAFLDHAISIGADQIATGHYAQVRENDGHFELLKGLDPSKDQSYFLHRLSQAQLSKALFPVGHLHKSEVRRIAQQINLPNAAKKDSTGICFIGERPFREFLNRYLSHQPGPILNDQGRAMGKHIGLSFYTLGQRKGIGIGGVKPSADELKQIRRAQEGQAWYVARKDMLTNTLYVVQGHDHPWLLGRKLNAADASWVNPEAMQQVLGLGPDHAGTLSAKTRYRQSDAPCEISSDGKEAKEGNVKTFQLNFSDDQWAMTPGQSAVLYRGDICLGGGVIV
jgi:tRNA-uridine 2-sulfurtransferase